MRAIDHAWSMLRWWQDAGIERADIAVRRASGTMIWHHDRLLRDLPLAWARAENTRRADVYVRPARGHAWATVFLDDVRTDQAVRIARRYGALVVETSAAGGCHVWLACCRPLDEAERKLAQVYLARRVAADLGSVSGEHLGRLAGLRNWKRGGEWINVVAASRQSPWEPMPALCAPRQRPSAPDPAAHATSSDSSESAREWGLVCGLLEAGCPVDVVHRRLADKARPRRGSDVERYARRTISQALRRASARQERPT